MKCPNLKEACRIVVLLCAFVSVACSSKQANPSKGAVIEPIVEGACELEFDDAGTNTGDSGASSGADAGSEASTDRHYLSEIGCTSDFNALASVPMDTSLSGSRSGKVVLDTAHGNALYFQNSKKYQLHYEFVHENLLDPGAAGVFETTQYYLPEDDRRFLLGAVTHYEGPGVWALELAAYDTMTPSMLAKLFNAIKEKAFFGPGLRFHPSSQALEKLAKKLDPSIPIITTSELYGTMDYQPLVRRSAMGQLLFFTSAQVESGTFIPYNAIVILDQAPNNISVVAGIISEEFQSPLSHINVLANNRGTPNMGLRNARNHVRVAPYIGKWVELTVGSGDFEIREVSAEEAAKYYDAHKPKKVTLSPFDTSIRGLWNIEDVVPNYLSYPNASKRPAIIAKVPAFGGKTVNYSVMAQATGIPLPKAFGIPMYYYDKFMRDNGLYDHIDRLLADSEFINKPAVRMEALRDFRNMMMKGTLDPELQAALQAKIAAEYTGTDGRPLPMRFRTSTNSEDLDAFPCAGCYESHTGDPGVCWEDVLNAIRLAYASIWLFRTYEERAYYQVDQKSVGMALLVHHTFQGETANGVAVTSNPFDSSGVDPALYINVAYGGEAEVVHLPPGVTTDQFLYYFGTPNNPIRPISSSNQIPEGTTVLTTQQAYKLGEALAAIHDLFRVPYKDPLRNWYAMDVEFKFAPVDAIGNRTSETQLWIKQARPYSDPNRGSTNTSND